MWLLVFLVILFASVPRTNCMSFDDDNETATLNKNCDKSYLDMPEGNMGQVPQFSWLGVLKVHLHEVKSYKVAVTGIILVKEKFAIANANDIARVPKTTLLRDSKAMFVVQHNNPWYCKVVDHMPHPEFQITTFNTVSILELSSNKDAFLPKPICWPPKNFNTSNELYVIGYTDENKRLEKTIHRMQYVDKKTCVEFYNRSNLMQDMTPPVLYQCGFLMNSRENCVWDNGMAVATNISGAWTLVGLIVQGPGCSAPARFLDTTTYMPWIVTSMTLDDNEDNPYGNIYDEMRRSQPGKSAFGVGFKKKKKSEVPIHTLFRSGNWPPNTDPELFGPHSNETIFGLDLPQTHILGVPENYSEGFTAQLTYPNKLVLNKTGDTGTLNKCDAISNVLVYREKIDINNDNNQGINMAEYTISLYDLEFKNFTCVTITIQDLGLGKACLTQLRLCSHNHIVWAVRSTDHTDPGVRAKTEFEEPVEYWFDYGPSLGPISSHHPEETIRNVLLPSLRPKPPKNETDWSPHQKLRPNFLKDTSLYYFPENAIKHFNIRVRLHFHRNASLDLSIFGEKIPPSLEPPPGKSKKTFLRNVIERPKSHRPKDANDINNIFWDDNESFEEVKMVYYPNDSTVNVQTKTGSVALENELASHREPETKYLKLEWPTLESRCDNVKYNTSIMVKELIVCCLVLKVLI